MSHITVLLIAWALLSVTTGAAAAAAQSHAPGVGVRQPENRLFVVGRDQAVAVEATLPASCTGSQVTVGLFQFGGAARINDVDPLFETAPVAVAPGGLVSGEVRLPSALPSGLKTVYPGVRGSCLPQPLVSTAPGLLIGRLDRTENPGASATFVVPRFSLFLGRPEQVQKGSLTAYANGVRCTTANLEDSSAKDADGNVRIHVGGPTQPSECSIDGAVVTFRFPNGALLYENRQLVLGVTQPFENLAPEVGPTTGAAPSAPDAGQSAAGARDSTGNGLRGDLRRAGLIALGLGLTAVVLFKGLRPRSP